MSDLKKQISYGILKKAGILNLSTEDEGQAKDETNIQSKSNISERGHCSYCMCCRKYIEPNSLFQSNNKANDEAALEKEIKDLLDADTFNSP